MGGQRLQWGMQTQLRQLIPALEGQTVFLYVKL